MLGNVFRKFSKTRVYGGIWSSTVKPRGFVVQLYAQHLYGRLYLLHCWRFGSVYLLL